MLEPVLHWYKSMIPNLTTPEAGPVLVADANPAMFNAPKQDFDYSVHPDQRAVDLIGPTILQRTNKHADLRPFSVQKRVQPVTRVKGIEKEQAEILAPADLSFRLDNYNIQDLQRQLYEQDYLDYQSQKKAHPELFKDSWSADDWSFRDTEQGKKVARWVDSVNTVRKLDESIFRGVDATVMVSERTIGDEEAFTTRVLRLYENEPESVMWPDNEFAPLAGTFEEQEKQVRKDQWNR